MDRKNKKTRSKVFTQGQSVGNQNNMVKINSPNYNKGKYIQNSDPMSIKPDFGPNCGGDLLWCEMHGECISQSDFDAGYCCDEAGNCQGDILSSPSQSTPELVPG